MQNRKKTKKKKAKKKKRTTDIIRVIAERDLKILFVTIFLYFFCFK